MLKNTGPEIHFEEKKWSHGSGPKFINAKWWKYIQAKQAIGG